MRLKAFWKWKGKFLAISAAKGHVVLETRKGFYGKFHPQLGKLHVLVIPHHKE